MIPVGSFAPDFSAQDQVGRWFRLSSYRGRRAVMLVFYPADWTPTCSKEIPELQALRTRFLREANTQVVGVSTDSRFSHNAWCAYMGGISYPVLADSSPPGAISRAYGAWIPGESISDRATVLIDPQGVVRYSATVGKMGRRNTLELLDVARRLIGPAPRGPAVVVTPFVRPMVLYVQTGCGHCDNVLRVVRNLGMGPRIRVRHIDQDPGAARDLAMMGQQGTPVMVVPNADGTSGQLRVGADDINAELARANGQEE